MEGFSFFKINIFHVNCQKAQRGSTNMLEGKQGWGLDTNVTRLISYGFGGFSPGSCFSGSREMITVNGTLSVECLHGDSEGHTLSVKQGTG